MIEAYKYKRRINKDTNIADTIGSHSGDYEKY
jgi:hypothetical protein